MCLFELGKMIALHVQHAFMFMANLDPESADKYCLRFFTLFTKGVLRYKQIDVKSKNRYSTSRRVTLQITLADFLLAEMLGVL